MSQCHRDGTHEIHEARGSRWRGIEAMTGPFDEPIGEDLELDATVQETS